MEFSISDPTKIEPKMALTEVPTENESKNGLKRVSYEEYRQKRPFFSHKRKFTQIRLLIICH